ncbi:MAG: sigma-70 family RNA polymerase sigma factor [Flavobacteriales bacterium]|nr:sigma-70 family RNA polymerase sigma factor [Flavobacteriales bacterium]
MTRAELNICIDKHGPRLLQFAKYQVNDHDLAKDLVQETFMALFGKINDVDPEKAVPFLYAVIRNRIKDHFKLRKNHSPIELYQGQEMPVDGQMEHKQIVNLALSGLDPRERELIVLRDLEGLSYEEIAELTNFNLGQVKVYLFRARKQFKEEVIKMELYYETPPKQ